MPFGLALRRVRRAAGLSQQELDYFNDLVRPIDVGDDIDAGDGFTYSMTGWLKQIEIRLPRWGVTPHGRHVLG